MQLYVKIQGAQSDCTMQVKAEPCGIVAENNLFSFMGPEGGRQQGTLRGEASSGQHHAEGNGAAGAEGCRPSPPFPGCS